MVGGEIQMNCGNYMATPRKPQPRGGKGRSNNPSKQSVKEQARREKASR